jgi:hypothetical protein
VPSPKLNVTEPVGVPPPGACALMVAVKVVAWPVTLGFAVDTNAVLVPAWVTVWVVDPVLGL